MAIGVVCLLTAGCLGVAAWADDTNTNDKNLMLAAWALILSGGVIMVCGLFALGYFHVPGSSSTYTM